MAKILIASNNPGKLVEFEALLHPVEGFSHIELILPHQIGLVLDVLEDGQTYAENAALKAQAYYSAISKLDGEKPIILADDSGLEVDCLGGAPGLHSARYSNKPEADDADRRAYLLHNLTGQPRPWQAHFHCTVALISPSGDLVYTHADCPGEVIPNERGSGGFGYDPIFFLPALGRTMAELSMEQKNQLSHRALAVKAAIPMLRQWLA